MSQALRRFDALEVVPVYQSCIVIVGVSWGWLFYAENNGLSPLSTGLFVLGCSLSIVGIAVLSMRPVAAEPAPAAAAAKGAEQASPTFSAAPASEQPPAAAAELRILAPVSPPPSPRAGRGGVLLRRQPSIYGSPLALPSPTASPSAGSVDAASPRAGSLAASTHLLLRTVSMSIHALHAVPPDGHDDDDDDGGEGSSMGIEEEREEGRS